MTGSPPALRGTAPIDAALAWEQFCDALKRAGQVLRRPQTPQDELTQAEGLRFLVHMLRVGFENGLDFADPVHPVLERMIDATKVCEGVTSDARYHHAFLDGSATYRIRGRRGGAPLIEFSSFTGKAGVQAESRQVASLTERDLVVGADGCFEVVLSPEPQPQNWLRTGPEARYLMVRQYAHDWSRLEEARMQIRRDGVQGLRPPLGLAELQRGLGAAADFAARAPAFWAAISDYWVDFAVNRFVPQLQADPVTDIAAPTGHQFSCGWFRLAPGEALVVRFAPAAVPYWSLGLANYWYETIGFGEGGSEIHDRNALREPDGSVRAVVADAPRSGRAGNWLDTRGHAQGTLVFRWSRSRDPVPPIETQLVPLAALERSR